MEAELRSAVLAAAEALEAAESLLQKAPAPSWLGMEIEALQERIERLKYML